MAFRELQAGDAARVLDAFVSDAEEMGRQGDVHDLATARAYVARMLDNPDTRTLVAVDDADRLLAFAAVSVDRDNANGWVFYWAHPEARQRGITSQLVRALADRELDEGGKGATMAKGRESITLLLPLEVSTATAWLRLLPSSS